MKKTIRNSQGFSIIELLVGLGIMTVIAAGLSTLATYNIRSMNYYEGVAGLTSLSQAIQTYSYNEENCKQHIISGTSIDYNSLGTESVIPFGLNIPGAGVFKSSEVISNYNIKVASFNLSNIQKIGRDTLNNYYLVGTLMVGGTILKQSLGGQTLKSRAIGPLNLKLDSSGKLISCSMAAMTFPGNGNNNNSNGSNVDNATLPSGTSVATLVTSTCNAACVVTDFFRRNSTGDTVAQANAWMQAVGETAYSTYANAYSMNQTMGTGGVPLNAVATGNSLGYSQAAVDSWTQQTYSQYNALPTATNNGANLYQSTVNGHNSAGTIYSPTIVQDYISQNGVASANAAALIVNDSARSGYSAAQTSSFINQANSRYTPDQIAGYFSSGGTIESAIAAGYINAP